MREPHRPHPATGEVREWLMSLSDQDLDRLIGELRSECLHTPEQVELLAKIRSRMAHAPVKFPSLSA